jgi:hypothetical protein
VELYYLLIANILLHSINVSQSERLELNDSRKRVDMVVTMARQLIDEYNDDDPMKIEADIRSIDEQWNVLHSV